MAVTQISVVIENAPGKAVDIFGALARAKVNVTAVSVAETADQGVVRLLVGDVAKAKAVLKKKGLSFTTAPVLAVAIPNRPGSLAKLLAPLAKKKINVEYLYGSTCACSADTCGCDDEGCANIIVLRIKDVENAAKALKAARYKLIKP